MKKSYVFGENTLAAARKFAIKPISIGVNSDSSRAVEDVVLVYAAIRKTSIVSPSIARTPTSI